MGGSFGGGLGAHKITVHEKTLHAIEFTLRVL